MNKTLVKILQSQGFGSRKECTWLIQKSGVRINGIDSRDPKRAFETDSLSFEVASVQWNYREKIYIMMNKPIGLECSTQPQHHDSVLELLPDQYINRGVQIAGRLDVDTEGLLLLSDDGQFIHHVTSPKRGVHKTYIARLKHEFSEEQREKLLTGVELHQEVELIKAVDVKEISKQEVEITVDRGCYHQVRRMFGAVSNRVESLRREKVGQLELESELEAGEWRLLEQDELANLAWKT